MTDVTPDAPDYMTVRELAELLRVKSRKVYGLAASGAIPCSRATGKILFPRHAVEDWLARHGGAGGQRAAVARPTVLVGSHDPLLDWALRESRSGIASLSDGSLDGLARFVSGEGVAAGLHLFEPDHAASGWNVRHVAERLADAPVVLIEWSWRERGLIVAPGNPAGIRTVADLAGRRMMPRQAEAASQLLLESLLTRAGIDRDDVAFAAPPARNEADLALAVADGKADAVLGLACMARQFRLDFVPVMRERYDLLVWRRSYFEPPFQRFIAFCRSAEFGRRAAEFGGYDFAGLGAVHFNGG